MAPTVSMASSTSTIAPLSIPIDGDHIWLVEQYRYTIGERAIEFPQGGWESEIDSPEELARGELREEAGLLAGRMTELPWMWIAYGFGRQRQHIVVAEELTLARRIATTKKPTWRSFTSPSRTSKKNSAPARSAMSAPLPPGAATSSGFATSAEPKPREIQKRPPTHDIGRRIFKQQSGSANNDSISPAAAQSGS
jgi:hypothetical protein